MLHHPETETCLSENTTSLLHGWGWILSGFSGDSLDRRLGDQREGIVYSVTTSPRKVYETHNMVSKKTLQFFPAKQLTRD